MSLAVLVFGDDLRAALAVIRSLGRAGYRVHIASSDATAPALSSRYIAAIHHIAPYWAGPERWCEHVRTLIAREAIDVLFPIDDRSVLPLRHHCALWPDTAIAAVDGKALDTFFDKHLTRELAKSCAVPVAPGRLLREDDSGVALAQDFGVPFYIKSRRSYDLTDLRSRGRVYKISSANEAEDVLARLETRSDFLVEGEAPGIGAGLSILAKNGNILAAFQHRRCREAPLGGSALRESIAVNPALFSAVVEMARATDMTGLAMTEWRLDSERGQYALLEVNARPWGSLPLAIAAGVDFPALHLEAMKRGGSSPLQMNDTTGIKRRALSLDLNGVQRAVQSALGRRNVLALGRAGMHAVGFCFAALSGVGVDSYASDDPMPFRRERALIVRQKWQAVLRLIPGYRQRKAIENRETIAHMVHAGAVNRVIFLCRGNQFRSAFAQHLMQKELALNSMQAEHDILSAGTRTISGQKTSDAAIKAAEAFGVDLNVHRTTSIWDLPPQAGDLWLGFDPIIDEEIAHAYPIMPSGSAYINLTMLDPLPPRDMSIHDPVDMAGRGQHVIFAQIQRSLYNLMTMLEG